MKSQLKNQPFLVPLCEGDFRLIVREQGTLFPMEARSRGWVKGEPVEGSSYFYHGQPILRTRRRTPFGFTSVELFSGCGGLSLGFQNAGFASVLGLDIHIPSTETFYRNHETAHCIIGDLRHVRGNDILDLLGRTPDVLLAGIPCQGFSLNNRKRHAEDPRNYLFQELLRIADVVEPRTILVENVSALSTAKSGSFLLEIIEGLRRVGYPFTAVQTLNALDYGVPQSRERIFIFASRVRGTFSWPIPSFGPDRASPYRTVADALTDLPRLASGQKSCRYDKEPSCDYQVLMRRRATELYNHEAPNHPAETIRRIARTRQGQPMYPKFKQRIRLSLQSPSPTQVSGGIRPQFQFGHPTQARGLSIRERCRIQSFPDDYFICGGTVQGRVQTGNAVPPLLAEAIGKQVMHHLVDG